MKNNYICHEKADSSYITALVMKNIFPSIALHNQSAELQFSCMFQQNQIKSYQFSVDKVDNVFPHFI